MAKDKNLLLEKDWSRIIPWLLLLCMVISIIPAWRWLDHNLALALYPYPFDYAEDFVLNDALRLAEGKPIYKNINQEPYLVATYPPFYNWLVSNFMDLRHPTFEPARLISFISSLLILALVFLIIFNHTKKLSLALFGMFLLTSLHPFYFWSPLARVDMLGIMFSLAGLYILNLYFHSFGKNSFSSSPTIWVVSILFVLSLYSKQTLIAAPISSFIFLFLQDKKKESFRFAAIILLIGSLAFLVLQFFSQGEFYHHLIIYNINKFYFSQALTFLGYFLILYPVFNLFALKWLLVGKKSLPFFDPENLSSSSEAPLFTKNIPPEFDLSRTLSPRPQAKPKMPLFSIYFIISFLLSWTVGKVGSNVNYLLETCIASIILTTLAINYYRLVEPKKLIPFLLLTAQVVLLVILPFIPLQHTIWNDPLAYTPKVEDSVEAEKMISVIKSEQELKKKDLRIFSLNLNGFILLTKNEIFMHPFIFIQLAKQELWKPDKFLAEFALKNWDLLILPWNLNSQKLQSELTFRSRLSESWQTYFIETVSKNYSVTNQGQYLGNKYFIYKPN